MSVHQHQPHPTRRAPAVTGQQVLAHTKAAPPASEADGEWLIIEALGLAVHHARDCKCLAKPGEQWRQMVATKLGAALDYAVKQRVSG